MTGYSVAYFERQEFLDHYWRYQSGEHLTILAPTKAGKTWLGYQLLQRSTSPNRQGVVLVMKPRDATVKRFSKAAGYRIVRSWPPVPTPWQTTKPPGCVVWPKHTFKPELDDPVHRRIFREVLLNSYKKGNRVVFADEVYGLANELHLERELVTLWSRARSMGTGLWVASQKPTHIPLWAYSQAEHVFLANDPDKRARERFDEIGGVDPGMVRAIVAKLPRHHFLYIRREGPVMCVIGK